MGGREKGLTASEDEGTFRDDENILKPKITELFTTKHV